MKVLVKVGEIEQDIPAYSYYSFSTGNKCPGCIGGWIETTPDDPKSWRMLRWRNCLGNDMPGHAPTLCSPCCWNIDWKVCRKQGAEGSKINEEDFGFCGSD